MCLHSTLEAAELIIRKWERNDESFLAAGGTNPSDEDLRHFILKIIPSSLSMEMRAKANAEQTKDSLKEWVRSQAEFAEETGSKHVNLVQQPAPTIIVRVQQRQQQPHIYGISEEQDDGDDDELDPQALVVTTR